MFQNSLPNHSNCGIINWWMLQACAYVAVVALHRQGHGEARGTHKAHSGINDIYSMVADEIFGGGELACWYAVWVLAELRGYTIEHGTAL